MKVLIILSTVAILAKAQFQCPKPKGQFEDERQCDKFYECIDGIATTKLCPDGLVFDPTVRQVNKCDHPFNVDCEDRTELQTPQPNHLCPRRNGFFAHPDKTVCDVFFNCIEGKAFELKCTNGLHFDQLTGTCAWPQTAGRHGCRVHEAKVTDSFECPREQQVNDHGLVITHPRFPNSKNCQRFYVCLNGVEPRDLGCLFGQVYNKETQQCDLPENVRGCESWYKESKEDTPARSRS